VGGGNSAGQATVFLARYASTVHLLVRHDDLGRDMSRYLVDQIEQLENVDVRLRTHVWRVVGEQGELRSVDVEHLPDGRRERLSAKALFVFIGAEPCTGWLSGYLALDERGYVVTGFAAAPGNDRPPALLETSRPGVMAVGDVRSGSVKRLASAVGEGAMAVRLVHDHLTQREG